MSSSDPKPRENNRNRRNRYAVPFARLSRASTPIVLAMTLLMMVSMPLVGCGSGRLSEMGRRAEEIADSLAAAAASGSLVNAQRVCHEASDRASRGAEFLVATRLVEMGFKCVVRSGRRVAQRPETFRIDEVQELVAWTDPLGSEDALFVAVSFDTPSEPLGSPKGLWPLAATLASLEVLLDDSTTRGVVLTISETPDWNVGDDSVGVAADQPYRTELGVVASLGPTPPLAPHREPGLLVGLTPPSDFPSTSGDLLAIRVVDGAPTDDDAALHDFAADLLRGLEAADGRGPSEQLPPDRQTLSWLLGIVLPIAFLAVAFRSYVVSGLTDIANVKRALRRTDARLAWYLLQNRCLGLRTDRRLQRRRHRHDRVQTRIERLKARREGGRFAPKAEKTAVRLKQLKDRKAGLTQQISEMERRLQDAQRQARHAEDALVADPITGTEKRSSFARLLAWVARTRLLVWVARIFVREHSDDQPQFVTESQRQRKSSGRFLEECRVRYREQRQQAGGIIAGAWDAAAAAMRKGGKWAFLAGGLSVMILAGVLIVYDWPERLTGLAGVTVVSIVLLIVWSCLYRMEHGIPMLLGAAVVTMLGLTSIELTALEDAFGDMFDSQRVNTMLIVTMAMLFLGDMFSNRAKQPTPSRRLNAHLQEVGATIKDRQEREDRWVLGASVLYLFVWGHFLAPAVDFCFDEPLRLDGDAVWVAAVAAVVFFLPVVSLYSARNVPGDQEPKGGGDNWC